MANKSVIEYPSVSDVLGTDVLYYIRGTGSDRDKKITVATLFANLVTPISANLPTGETGRFVNIQRNSVDLFSIDKDKTAVHHATAETKAFVIGDINLWSHATVGAITETIKTLWINSKVQCGDITSAKFIGYKTTSTDNAIDMTMDQLTLEAVTNEAVDGFGSARTHIMKTLAGGTFQQGFYGFRRDGANNTHKFVLACNRAGATVTALEAFGDYVKVKGAVFAYRKVNETAQGLFLNDYHIELIEDASTFILDLNSVSTSILTGQTFIVKNSRSTNCTIDNGEFGAGTLSITLPANQSVMFVWDGGEFVPHNYAWA